MMKTKETEMNYIGKILNNGLHYEVITDEANDIINIFFKNTKDGDVECWSLKKSSVQQARGKDTLSKTKNYWSELSKYSTKKLESIVFLQTFPWEFWADVVLPIKNGQQSDFTFEFQTGEENDKKTELKNLLKTDNEELPINPFTGNQVLSFLSVEKNIDSINKELEKGNLVIFQYPQGDCLLLNNTGITNPYKMIQYDPKNGKAIRAELPKEAIKLLVDSLSKDKMVQNYSLFMIKRAKEDLIEDFVEITNGLLNLITSNDNYKIRDLG